MHKYYPLKYKDIAKVLKRMWCNEAYNMHWSHIMWYNPKNDIFFDVVNHQAKEILTKTIELMLKSAWINRSEFYEYISNKKK